MYFLKTNFKLKKQTKMARRNRRRSRGRAGRSFFSFGNWLNLLIVAALGYVGFRAWGDKISPVKDVLDSTSDKLSDMTTKK